MESAKTNVNFLVEVNNIEKQLWTLIQSKGISHQDVSELYFKAALTYEQIFKTNLQHEELQEVEFCLWKLHYKHIDEFRKGIKTDDHMKAFRLFLSKAAEFYKNLICKVREESDLQKSRFLCHRFYICLGDLERYKEQYLKTTNEHRNWSAAATYYLESAKSWPDSGNPHNQLAVLSTYVGDEFLALYHCVRSLAVKDPFPGALNNLLLLFEKNRSCTLQSLSADAQFNFLNPSERYATAKDRDFSKGNLWPLIVRTTSFFFLKSSFDEFDCTFASTMRELDAVFEADDRNLEAMLESYQVMNTARKGPYRILQLVTVFIFIFHNLTECNGSDHAEEKVKLTNSALAMVFIVMGRLVDRCLKTIHLDSCPLLPGLLVFLEYLPLLLEKVEESKFDEKAKVAVSYFFDKLVEFLNRIKSKKGENSLALWEDHELRSLAPLAPIHEVLDFSSCVDLGESFDRGKQLRLHRIRNSATEIISRQKKRSQFYRASGECKDEIFNGRYVNGEDEEVILLKPLVRCQSTPISKPFDNNTASEDRRASSDENLRRSSSLIVNHSPQDTKSESFSFLQGLKETDLNLEEEDTLSGRPPSLSAWVVNKNKERSKSGLTKPTGLSPIDETNPVTSFGSSTEDPASLYTPPTPSAPLLPEDASWFHNDQTRFMKPYTNPPFTGMSSSEWLRRYRESRNLGPGPGQGPAYSYQAQGRNNISKFLARGSSKFSLLAKYGTPNDQSMISSENSGFDPQLYVEDHGSRGEKLFNGQESKPDGYGFSDDPGPFIKYLREKEWLNENGQKLRE